MDIEQFYINEEDKKEPARIIPATSALPRHTKKEWVRRPLYDCERVIVHQAFADNETTSFYDLTKKAITPGNQNYENPQGFAGFRYHYAIDRNGQTYCYNAGSCLTHHCNQNNYNSLGVLVMGDFDGITYKGKNGDPSDFQMRSLLKLLKHLTIDSKKLNIKQDQVYGHNDFGKENCPGQRIYNFIKSFRTHEFETENSASD